MAQRVCVVLSAAEREQLVATVADRNRPRKHVERARIVLASADRHSATVWRWQQRFAESGVEGLLRDKTRKPGKAPIAVETTARVVALTCAAPPHQGDPCGPCLGGLWTVGDRGSSGSSAPRTAVPRDSDRTAGVRSPSVHPASRA
jgi:hypothetical protein